jgi:hypothetical protein
MELNNSPEQQAAPTPPPADQPPKEAIALTKPRYEEGQVINKTYNANGPVNIVWREGKQVFEMPQKEIDPEWQSKTFKLKPKHHQAFLVILSYLSQRHQSKYPVPVLLQEVEQHVAKPVVKELKKYGFIEIQQITFAKDGKQTGARNALWLTGSGEMLAKAMTQVAERKREEAIRVPEEAVKDISDQLPAMGRGD